jgi:predicted esterase
VWRLGGAAVVGVALGGGALVLTGVRASEPVDPGVFVVVDSDTSEALGRGTPVAVDAIAPPAGSLVPPEESPAMLPPGPSSSVPPPSPSSSAAGLSRETPPTCGDIVFLGLRGSGEMDSDHGDYGSAVGPVRDAVREAVMEAGLTFVDAPVAYPAEDVPALDWRLVADMLEGRTPYVTGAQVGADMLVEALHGLRTQCPSTTRAVVVGFSQGAMAARLGLSHADPVDLTAVVSVDLIADPLRAPGEANARGEAAPEQGIARFAPDWPAIADAVGPADAAWRSWCAQGDAVCAAAPPGAGATTILVALTTGLMIHAQSYQSAVDAVPVAAAIEADLSLPE